MCEKHQVERIAVYILSLKQLKFLRARNHLPLFILLPWHEITADSWHCKIIQDCILIDLKEMQCHFKLQLSYKALSKSKRKLLRKRNMI